MASVYSAPHKLGGRQRYLPEDSGQFSKHQADLATDDSNVEPNALQSVKEPEWDGFDDEEKENSGEEEGEEDDVEGMEIQQEAKKKEKIIMPKDAEEEELERILFGDSAGFKEGLDAFSLGHGRGAYDDSSDASGADEADLDQVADNDLFFFDAGPVAAPAGSVPADETAASEDEDDKPAWEDSDDEQLVVSLASVPQLRKLRETVDDDMVNGREYARRLRKQYERLYPAPAWATHATGKAAKKRRRTMDDDESGEDSASDMDLDDEDLSAQPLARLLKDADLLSRTSTSTAKRRKLQAGTVDIQRLKDVIKSGPVSVLMSFGCLLCTNFFVVCHYLAVFSSVLPAPPFLWSQLNPLPPPY